jgi:hypothetical protein
VLSVNVRPVTVSFRPPARPGEGVGGGGSSLLRLPSRREGRGGGENPISIFPLRSGTAVETNKKGGSCE